MSEQFRDQPDDFLRRADWTFPIPIAYGPGRFGELPAHCELLNLTNPLIVTDRGTSELSFISEAIKLLESFGIRNSLFTAVNTNPTYNNIVRATLAFQSGGHDSVIAIGGGSAMDAGKAVALTARGDLDLWAFDFDRDPPNLTTGSTFPPLLCVPTTSGTGAETESTAMITDTNRAMKFCVWHPLLKPKLALLDPELTLGLPKNLTAWTGIDALVHALESYCVPSTHPMCDGIALHALKIIWTWLPTAVNEPNNLEARGAMQIASCMAGVAFNKGLGLVHSISHSIGAEYGQHHGLINAITLPAVLRFNEPAISSKCAEIVSYLNVGGFEFGSLYYLICGLLDELEIPKSLSEIGVPSNASRSLAMRALNDSATQTNPRGASLEDLVKIIEEAIDLGR